MKLVLQRVLNSKVEVDNKIVGSSSYGFCILAGMEETDTISSIKKIANKIVRFRVFSDENGKMNKSILDVNGSILLVSQFTLLADCNSGCRPSFSHAGNPQKAQELFNQLFQELKNYNISVQTGVFGAEMLVSLQNSGPATFILQG